MKIMFGELTFVSEFIISEVFAHRSTIDLSSFAPQWLFNPVSKFAKPFSFTQIISIDFLNPASSQVYFSNLFSAEAVMRSCIVVYRSLGPV